MSLPEPAVTPGRKTLVLMAGLPRSGKTTRALSLSREHGWPIVCPDAIRLGLHGRRFVGLAEPFVWAVARLMVRALFLAGHDAVVLDATNGTRRRRDEWRDAGWVRQFCVIDTAREACLARAAAEGDAEIGPVIERMAAAWEPVAAEESGP
jgi:predicted kinase